MKSLFYFNRYPRIKQLNIRYLWLVLLTSLFPSQYVFCASEYELKAAFLYNLSNFITWQDSAFSSESSPFFLCVLGFDHFGSALDSVTAGQKVAGHNIQIMKLTDDIEAKSCHLLFISNSEHPKMSKIFNNLKDTSILTVGDTDDFITQGGMIMFVSTSEGKIKLTIHHGRILDAQLKASSRLLQIATVIK